MYSACDRSDTGSIGSALCCSLMLPLAPAPVTLMFADGGGWWARNQPAIPTNSISKQYPPAAPALEDNQQPPAIPAWGTAAASDTCRNPEED